MAVPSAESGQDSSTPWKTRWPRDPIAPVVAIDGPSGPGRESKVLEPLTISCGRVRRGGCVASPVTGATVCFISLFGSVAPNLV